MPRYMLDTDTCSYIMKRSNQTVLNRLQKIPVTDICTSVVSKSELLYGVEVSPRRAQDGTALSAFLRYVQVLDFPDDAATHYAQIRADLKKRGQMIGANDLFIAAHARSVGLTLVTNNTAEFGRQPTMLDCSERLNTNWRTAMACSTTVALGPTVSSVSTVVVRLLGP